MSFEPPRTATTLIARTDLMRDLGAYREPFVLITAPAGFGKTSLLSSHYHLSQQQGRLTVWLTVDPEILGTVSFANQLLSALSWPDKSQQINTDHIGLAAKALHDAIILRQDRVASHEPRELHVYIDDFHEADSEANRALLLRFARALPRHARLFAATRRLPKLPVSDLLVKQVLRIIDGHKLRFSESEARQFLGDGLAQHRIERLIEQSEGWPGGLQLLKLAEEDGASEGSLAPRPLVQSQEMLWSFLTEQVLTKLEKDERDFLKATCVLGRFDVELAHAVTGNKDAALCLQTIYQNNLFLEKIGSAPDQYRYHRLFAQFLRRHFFDARNAGERAEFHRRAARCLIARQDWERGLRHGAEVGDLQFFADCVKLGGGWHLTLRFGAMIWDVLEHFSVAEVRLHPILVLCKAYALLHRGQIRQARELYNQLAQDSPGLVASRSKEFDETVFELLLTSYEGRLLDDEESQRLVAVLHKPARDRELPLQALLAELLAWNARFADRLQEAVELGWQSERLCEEAEVPLVKNYALLAIGSAQLALGNLNRAARYFDDAKHRALREFGCDHAQYLAAVVYRETVNIELGHSEADGAAAIKLIERAGHSDQWAELAYLVARAASWFALASGGLPQARAVLDQLHDATLDEDVIPYGFIIEVLSINSAYVCSAPLPSHYTLHDGLPSIQPAQDSMRTFEYLRLRSIAQHALLCGDPDGATSPLASLDAHVARTPYEIGFASVALLHAHRAHLNGDRGAALGYIESALQKCEPATLVAPLCEAGLWLNDYLDTIQSPSEVGQKFLDLARGRRSTFLKKIVNRADETKSDARLHIPICLSRREGEVFELLCRGMTSKEIARQMELSPNTVMSYRKALIKKLGVSSRSQLVDLAWSEIS